MGLPPSLNSLRRRIEAWTSGCTASMAGHRKVPVQPTDWQPRVRVLEPRVVLNASAELNPLGQLLVVGTGFNDPVRIEFDANEALQIFDADTLQVIPITGHPDGPGAELNPLPASEITSRRVSFELGPGDDALSLPLLGDLNVVVLGESGVDSTELRLDPFSEFATGSLVVQTEQIRLASSLDSLSLGRANVELIGDVRFDRSIDAPQLQVDGELTIQGPLTLSNDVSFVGGGSIDLDQSVISADEMDVNLRFTLTDGDVRLGNVDDSGGQTLQNLSVDSASEITLVGTEVSTLNSIEVANAVERVQIESDLKSDVILIQPSDRLDVLGTITAPNGITLAADDVRVLADLTTTDADIRISGVNDLTIANQARIFASQGSLLFVGNGNFQSADAILQSDFVDEAIVFQNFANVNLGQAIATEGQLTLGLENQSIHSFTQADSTAIMVERVSGTVDFDVDLANDGNQIRSIVDLVVGCDVEIVDSADDLLLESLKATNGTIDVMAAGGLLIGRIEAADASGLGSGVTLNANRINDAADDSSIDIVSQFVSLNSTSGIGDLARLELDGTTDLVANNVVGDVALLALGDQSIAVRQLATTGGDVSITTTGKPSDILVGQITVLEGDVFLAAADDILDLPGSSSLLTADGLRLISSNMIDDQATAVDLRVDVKDLAANVEGSNRGDLFIEHVAPDQSLRIGKIDLVFGGRIDPLETGNGQIVINSVSAIDVVDLTPDDADGDLKGDPEFVANRLFGRIDLEAPTISLRSGVQLHADQLFQPLDQAAQPRPLDDLTEAGGNRSQRSIYLAADEVNIGDDVELFTGDQQGTARQFLPRSISDSGSQGQPLAFFDPASVRTNVLSQALQNDATGILTVKIGTEGEKGLTATIDWGDSDGRRFQQVDGIDANQNSVIGVDSSAAGQPIMTSVSAGDGTVRFTHLYLEQDTVESTSNGRASATDPYTVFFAVRHHDSIVIEGRVEGESALISQNGISTNVAGGILSSTDDPTTNIRGTGPRLESGQATFIIPALTIPVAFFPVRDVIPEFESPEIVVSVQQPIEVTTSTLEITEIPVTSIINREEYFRLRVLSPDPNGADLAPPEKLPAEIFSGNRLSKFFSKLPDGAYQIEYVLGDGNERSILRVEVRDGEATIPEDELEEEILRLTPLKMTDGELEDDYDRELPSDEQDSNTEENESNRSGESSQVDAGNQPSVHANDADMISRDDLSATNQTRLLASLGTLTLGRRWLRSRMKSNQSRFSPSRRFAQRRTEDGIKEEYRISWLKKIPKRKNPRINPTPAKTWTKQST